jgi:hypothetical protein
MCQWQPVEGARAEACPPCFDKLSMTLIFVIVMLSILKGKMTFAPLSC